MRLFSRVPTPPSVKAVHLQKGERRVAWALTADRSPVVASTRGLHLPGGTMLAWDQIERVQWVRPILRLTELTEREHSGREHEVSLDLDQETELPEAVKARVTASVAWSSHIKLQPAGGVRLVGRRRVGMEILDWQLVFDRDTDPADPALRAQAEAHLAAARRAVG